MRLERIEISGLEASNAFHSLLMNSLPSLVRIRGANLHCSTPYLSRYQPTEVYMSSN